ncbi:hypothetical protein E2019_22960 [Salmonella enterica subsp. enterica serovar Amager]|nr:hypothetical protein [Salmonella enterica subsp. enterica serovar Amager]ECF3422715.1 hypothetical protein [Salmonella enterica subsp. enterica serovar Amager]
MAVNQATRKALAEKHNTRTVGDCEDAIKYMKNIQKGLLKEMDKLDKEYETGMTRGNNPHFVETVEKNFVHWRHILVSAFEALEHGKQHWEHIKTGNGNHHNFPTY